MVTYLLSLLASVSFQIAEFSANSSCHLICYEMEMPDQVKALRRDS